MDRFAFRFVSYIGANYLSFCMDLDYLIGFR